MVPLLDDGSLESGAPSRSAPRPLWRNTGPPSCIYFSAHSLIQKVFYWVPFSLNASSCPNIGLLKSAISASYLSLFFRIAIEGKLLRILLSWITVFAKLLWALVMGLCRMGRTMTEKICSFPGYWCHNCLWRVPDLFLGQTLALSGSAKTNLLLFLILCGRRSKNHYPICQSCSRKRLLNLWYYTIFKWKYVNRVDEVASNTFTQLFSISIPITLDHVNDDRYFSKRHSMSTPPVYNILLNSFEFWT